MAKDACVSFSHSVCELRPCSFDAGDSVLEGRLPVISLLDAPEIYGNSDERCAHNMNNPDLKSDIHISS